MTQRKIGNRTSGLGVFDDCDTTMGASALLADLLLDKYHAGKWFATDICKVAYLACMGAVVWAGAGVGVETGVADIAL